MPAILPGWAYSHFFLDPHFLILFYREPLLVQKGMKLLKETSELRKSPKLQEMYRNQEKKLSDWKFEFEEKSSPGVHEIMNVLRY